MNKLPRTQKQKIIGFFYIFSGIAFMISNSWGLSDRYCEELPEICGNILSRGTIIFVFFSLLGLFHIFTRRFTTLKIIIDVPLLILIIWMFAISLLFFLFPPSFPLPTPPPPAP